jgi:hypothetical protein
MLYAWVRVGFDNDGVMYGLQASLKEKKRKGIRWKSCSVDAWGSENPDF